MTSSQSFNLNTLVTTYQGQDPQGDISEQIQSSLALNVKSLGAKGDGIADDSTAFQNTINAASTNGIKTLVARGTFYINATVNLLSNIDYDFQGATFISGAGCGSYLFLGYNVSNINVKYGSHIDDSRAAHTTIPTGTYVQSVSFHFDTCQNVHVERFNSYNIMGLVNFYNCTDCSATRNFTKDCDAAFCANTTNAVVRNISFNFNIIRSGGDDGIAFLTNSTYELEDCEAMGNQIDKVTRADGSLNGSTGAAVGIRVSRMNASYGLCHHVIVKGNIFKDMVQNAIYTSGTKNSTVSDNIINGFGKSSAPAIQIGGDPTTDTNDNMIISKNIITGAYTDSQAIVLNAVTDSLVEGNKAKGFGIGGQGLLFLNNSTNNAIKNNKMENTKAYSIQLYGTSNNNELQGNDVSVYSALPISIASGITGTKIGRNKGFEGTTSPTAGYYNKGNLYYHSAPVAGGNIGWVYTGDSNDTTLWKTFGTIGA